MASYTSVAALKALFPDTPDAALQESLLQARGNVDQAASLLLEKDATGPQNEGIVKQALKVCIVDMQNICTNFNKDSEQSNCIYKRVKTRQSVCTVESAGGIFEEYA